MNTMPPRKGMLGIRTEHWQEARAIIDDARRVLNRWAARYAGTEHAKGHKKETNELIDRIDRWIKDKS